jgi:hypothetical protein
MLITLDVTARCDCPRHRGGEDCSDLLPLSYVCKAYGFGDDHDACTRVGTDGMIELDTSVLVWEGLFDKEWMGPMLQNEYAPAVAPCFCCYCHRLSLSLSS